MATYDSPAVAAGVPPRAIHAGVTQASASFALTAALALNDVVRMVKVPRGATVLDVVLATTDLDTGSPAIVLDVGDGDDADRFVDGATIGQGGGVARMNNPAGARHAYAADDTVDVLVATAPGTGATSGTITLSVLYTMEG